MFSLSATISQALLRRNTAKGFQLSDKVDLDVARIALVHGLWPFKDFKAGLVDLTAQIPAPDTAHTRPNGHSRLVEWQLHFAAIKAPNIEGVARTQNVNGFRDILPFDLSAEYWSARSCSAK